MTETTPSTQEAPASHGSVSTATPSTRTTTIAWLESEFPGWTVDLDESSTWDGNLRPLWIARMEGHHPQAELSAAKLHTRLTEYLDRAAARRAMGN